jgi:predicted nucleic acid-binding protein
VRYVLDTNIAAAALNSHPAVVSRLAAVPLDEVGLPILALGELFF